MRGVTMNLKHLVPAVALGCAVSMSAFAADRDPPARIEALLDPQVLFGGVVTEQDVSLVFAHLRAAMLAAAEGREPPPLPEALSRRLESAGAELRLRGIIAGLALSHVVERAVRDAVRELNPPRGSD